MDLVKQHSLDMALELAKLVSKDKLDDGANWMVQAATKFEAYLNQKEPNK